MNLYYSKLYTSAKFNFDTTRKATWIADSLIARPIAGVTVKEPEPLTMAQLNAVHDPHYVDAVRTGKPRELAASSGFDWDPNVWDAVTSSNGGAVAATLDAYRLRENAGSLSSGLHHAGYRSGAAFCTFNGLALAAKAVLDAGAQRVLILDLDAHCGGGTHQLTKHDPRIVHVDISTSSVDQYATPDGPSSLDIIGRSRYFTTLGRRLREMMELPAFDVLIYNAGMDPHDNGLTHDKLHMREQIVFRWAEAMQLPAAFVLAGGYTGRLTQEALVNLHRLTIAEAVTPTGETAAWQVLLDIDLLGSVAK